MRGWSQVDVANASGVAAAQISRYEQGSNTPRPQVVARLATALGVSFSWLLTGAGQPVDPWLAGRSTLRVELPEDLIRRIEQAASQNRRLVDEEVQARLEASFGSLQGSLRGFEMTAQIDSPNDKPLTPGQLELAKAVAAEVAKQVVEMRIEGLNLVTAGVGRTVLEQPPNAAPVSLPKLMEQSGAKSLGELGDKVAQALNPKAKPAKKPSK